MERADLRPRRFAVERLGDEPPISDAIEPAAVGPDPDRAGRIAVQLSDGVVREAIRHGVVREATALEVAQAAVGPNPDSAVVVSAQPCHDVADEPVSGGVDRELAVLQSTQPAAVRADPQAVIAAFGERPDLVFLQLLLVAVVERRESHAVEARQATLCADPEIRIAGLKKAENAVLRESLRLPPDLDRMNRRLLCGLACAGAFGQEGDDTEHRRRS